MILSHSGMFSHVCLCICVPSLPRVDFHVDVIQVQHTYTHTQRLGCLYWGGCQSIVQGFVLSVSSLPPPEDQLVSRKSQQRKPAEADPTQENNTNHMLAQQLLA